MPDNRDEWDDTVASLPGEAESQAGQRPSRAFLVVVRGNDVGQTHPITGPTMVIGRGSGSDLRLNNEGVSRFHCKLHLQPNGIAVEDLGSRNGTFCNGERVLPGTRLLSEGDRLQIGTTCVFRFTYVETDETPTASPEDDRAIGGLSRRAFMERLEQSVAAALDQKLPLSLTLIHVDRFAEIAADRGQPVLDGIMVDLAGYVRESARPDDLLARMGPGDLALLSRRASPGDTFMFAERLRKRAFAAGPPDEPPALSLSLGVAAIHELQVESAHDLLVAAGSALHRARSSNGNRTVLCTPDLVRDPKSRVRV